MGVSIKGVFTEKLGLVSHQNAVPLVGSLTITNDSDEDLESLSLDLSPALPFAKAKGWPVDRLIAGSEISLPDRDIRLSESYLADLTESVNTGVDVRVRSGSEVLAEQRFSVELLARNEWGGAGGMAELLPPFARPMIQRWTRSSNRRRRPCVGLDVRTGLMGMKPNPGSASGSWYRPSTRLSAVSS